MNLPPVADAVAIPVIPVAELPHEAPMPMPVQDLGRGELSGRELATTPRTIHVRRLATIGGAGVLTLVAAYQIWWLLRGGGIDVLEAVLLVLFTLLFAWIALAFTTAAAGFMLAMRGGRMRLGIDPADPLPSLHVRTALLMPIYNEDPTRVMTGLQAIHESVAATGRGAHFDVFVLSDTRNPAIQAAERAAFSRLRASVGAAPRVFYRLRDDNHERKAGNIAEWVRRFGADYPQMLILDADSLMTGDTIVRLAAAMDAHDDVALIQTLPVIVNGNTLFARMQQFAGRVYGPVAAHGIAWWHGAESNYWGHNAIIRTSSFAAHAGLPPIRGYKPFGGAVLSHDFVEAALMRRGGWALHMVPGLSGSYEEGPPSLTDMMIRDRRWCQGNLQHGAVLPARGLHWVSRMHMMVGIGHYFTAPMWAMLMLVGLAIPLQAAGILDGPLPLDGFSPVGYWRAQDPDRFFYVFLLTMALLFGPKLLGFTAMLLDRGFRHACGGGLRATLSLLLESVLAALMAPITMYVQSRGVAQVLAGKDSGWESQRRDDGTLPLSSLVRLYGGLTVFGAFMGVVAYLVSPGLAAWMAPVTVGMVLSIPIVAWTSSRGAGLWLRRHRIFATPEERDPPKVLQRAAELRAGAGPG